MPVQWNPNQVAVSPDDNNSFLLRPGQILVCPGDAAVVARVLDGTGWKGGDARAFGITLFQKRPDKPETAAQEVLDTIAKVRKATAGRKQGPARVAPNHVFVGESVPATADAINFMGEPRIQGGPGSTVRPAFGPKALPARNALAGDGKGARIAVLDTGMFEHEWLSNVGARPYADDVWDVENDGYGDNESGHGTFIAGLIQQVAPAASVYAVKVLDSHGVGDDLKVAEGDGAAPANVNIVNLSLGGYTDGDQPPMAIACAMQIACATPASSSPPPATRRQAARSGPPRSARSWPSAPSRTRKAVGAPRPTATTARGSTSSPAAATCSRRSHAEDHKVAQGPARRQNDPSVSFDGWAEWDGTSFSTPIAAAMIARTMTRTGDLLRAGRRVQAHADLAERRAGGVPEREAGRRAALTPTSHGPDDRCMSRHFAFIAGPAPSGSCSHSGSSSSSPRVRAGVPEKYTDAQENESTSFLPGDAESTKALTAAEELQGGELAPAVILYRRESGLTAADKQKIVSDVEALTRSASRPSSRTARPPPRVARAAATAARRRRPRLKAAAARSHRSPASRPATRRRGPGVLGGRQGRARVRVPARRRRGGASARPRRLLARDGLNPGGGLRSRSPPSRASRRDAISVLRTSTARCCSRRPAS